MEPDVGEGWSNRPQPVHKGSTMAPSRTHRERVNLYIRMTLGASLLGIAYGFILQVMGLVKLAPFDVFSYAIRGTIIGALFWYFEIFWVHGPRGIKLRSLSYGQRLIIRVIVYFVLIQGGILIGHAIFEPQEALNFFMIGTSP